jgi:MFS family permease
VDRGRGRPLRARLIERFGRLRSFTGLWRNPDFLKLWSGRTVSNLGTQVMQMALPLAAVLVLGATPLQMGVLRAVAATPDFLFGFVAGAWVDRGRRRPLMIGTDVCQAIVVGSIPVAALLGALHLPQLYVVAFMGGALALVFDVSSQSYIPALLGSEDLVEGNSKLAASSSLSSLLGPALGGSLVQLLTAPVAITLNSLSFLVSAVSVLTIGAPEPPPASTTRPGFMAFWRSIGQGLRFMLENRVLLALAVAAGLFNLFDGVIFAVYILYATRQLGIPPVLLGVIIAAGGVGGLLGAVAAGSVSRRMTAGGALLGALLIATAGEALIALASGPVAFAAGVLLTAEILVALGATLFSINYLTLRQLVTPAELQGRIHATNRTIITGLVPVGALAGGIIAQLLGLRAPLIIGAAGTLLAAVLLFASPVRSWRSSAQP